MAKEKTDNPTGTPADTRTARVRVLVTGTPVRSLICAKGAVVAGVPIADAEYKANAGKLQILEITG